MAGKMDIDVEVESAAFGAIKEALNSDEDPAEASAAIRETDEKEKEVEQEIQSGKKAGEEAGAGKEKDAPAGGADAGKTPGAEATEEAAAKKKADEEAAAAAGGEGAGKPKEGEQEQTPEVFKVRVRGVDRELNREEVVSFAQKGMNYETLVGEFDEKVKTRAKEMQGDWLGAQGIVVSGSDGKPAISAEGALRWAQRLIGEAYGANAGQVFQEALAKVSVAPEEDMLSVAAIDKELEVLDADIDEARIRDLKRMRQMAVRLEAMPKTVKDAVDPLDQRLNEATKAEQAAKAQASVAVLDKHLDAELAKIPGFTTSKYFTRPSDPADPKSPPIGRAQIIATARGITSRAHPDRLPTVEEAQAALTQSTKFWADAWQEDRKSASEEALAAADKLRNGRPAPKTTAPSPGAKGGAGGSGPSKHKVGSPEWSKEQAERLGQIHSTLRTR